MKHYGLIGKPLIHSFSADFFNKKFKEENIDAEYKLYELDDLTNDFANLTKSVDLSGLNVTIPYKEKIIPLLDELDETARNVGAVNVIKFKGGKLIGYNSDVIGFENSLKKQLKPHHQKALILGTGGASKAVAYILGKLGISYTFVSRKKKENGLTYDELSEQIMRNHLLIVNASPVGTFPHSDECPAIPYQFLTSEHYLFDLIYNPEKTVFLQEGEKRGCAIQNGLEMLHGQAVAAWNIWES